MNDAARSWVNLTQAQAVLTQAGNPANRFLLAGVLDHPGGVGRVRRPSVGKLGGHAASVRLMPQHGGAGPGGDHLSRILRERLEMAKSVGHNPFVLMAMMGHSQITTSQIYCHTVVSAEVIDTSFLRELGGKKGGQEQDSLATQAS